MSMEPILDTSDESSGHQLVKHLFESITVNSLQSKPVDGHTPRVTRCI